MLLFCTSDQFLPILIFTCLAIYIAIATYVCIMALMDYSSTIADPNATHLPVDAVSTSDNQLPADQQPKITGIIRLK